ncbi:MAG: hypothetical protein AAFY57_03130 [Cyanobacteria bacterium J06642_2]
MNVRSIVDRILRTHVLTRDQKDQLAAFIWNRDLSSEEQAALDELAGLIAKRSVISYPELCL